MLPAPAPQPLYDQPRGHVPCQRAQAPDRGGRQHNPGHQCDRGQRPYPPRRATSPDTATPEPLNKAKGLGDTLRCCQEPGVPAGGSGCAGAGPRRVREDLATIPGSSAGDVLEDGQIDRQAVPFDRRSQRELPQRFQVAAEGDASAASAFAVRAAVGGVWAGFFEKFAGLFVVGVGRPAIARGRWWCRPLAPPRRLWLLRRRSPSL